MKYLLLVLSAAASLVAGPIESLPVIIKDPYISNTGWLDLFGSLKGGEVNVGVAASFFLTKHIGVGVESQSPLDINGLLILRYPIEKYIISPYTVLAAGDSGFSTGIGTRIALDHDFDLFLEGRYHWWEVHSSELRAGIGFRFW